MRGGNGRKDIATPYVCRRFEPKRREGGIILPTACCERGIPGPAKWPAQFRLFPRAIFCKMEFMESTATETPALLETPATSPVVTEHIGVRRGYCGGEPHILGHRIKVRHVAVWYDRCGMTPTEIVVTHPTITLAQVHAALAYYYDHRDEIDAAIEEEHRFVNELKTKSPTSKLQELVAARKTDASDDSVPPG
jgi:uncharacterized protein (DUF433 family)